MTQTCKIILIEDTASDAFLFETILERAQYKGEYSYFSNGVDLLQSLSSNQNQEEGKLLMFIDYNLPYHNGYELAQKIKEIQELRQVSIIIMSNVSPPMPLDRQFYEVANVWLEKNFEFDKFAEDVVHLIQSNLSFNCLKSNP